MNFTDALSDFLNSQDETNEPEIVPLVPTPTNTPRISLDELEAIYENMRDLQLSGGKCIKHKSCKF